MSALFLSVSLSLSLSVLLLAFLLGSDSVSMNHNVSSGPRGAFHASWGRGAGTTCHGVDEVVPTSRLTSYRLW